MATQPPIHLRVRATYSVKGASERTRVFDVVVPEDRAEQLGTEWEIFLLYDLVAEKIDADRELMLSNAEILSDKARGGAADASATGEAALEEEALPA